MSSVERNSFRSDSVGAVHRNPNGMNSVGYANGMNSVLLYHRVFQARIEAVD